MKACSEDALRVESLQNVDMSELTRICTGFEVIKVEWSKRPELRTTLKAGAKSLMSKLANGLQ